MNLLIFAIIAVFIISKLLSVLGDTRYNGNDSDHSTTVDFEEYNRDDDEEEEEKKVVNVVELSLTKKQKDLFDEIRKQLPLFTADWFLETSVTVFEMLLEARQEKNEEVIENLCDEKVVPVIKKDDFGGVLVSISEQKIKSISRDENNFSITVHIVSTELVMGDHEDKEHEFSRELKFVNDAKRLKSKWLLKDIVSL